MVKRRKINASAVVSVRKPVCMCVLFWFAYVALSRVNILAVAVLLQTFGTE